MAIIKLTGVVTSEAGAVTRVGGAVTKWPSGQWERGKARIFSAYLYIK